MPIKTPPLLTSAHIKDLAGKGLRAPSTLTTDETRELAASVLRHVEPRKGEGKPPAKAPTKKAPAKKSPSRSK